MAKQDDAESVKIGKKIMKNIRRVADKEGRTIKGQVERFLMQGLNQEGLQGE